MNYNKDEVIAQMIEEGWSIQSANEVAPYLDAAYKAGREEMEKPLREAIHILEDEIPFTGEEVIAKIKEALK